VISRNFQLRIAFALIALLVVPGVPMAIAWIGGGGNELLAFLSGLAYPPAFVLGIPLYALLSWMQWRRWWQYFLGGLIIGIVDVGFWMTLMPSLEMRVFLIVGLAGGLLAILFWVIAVALPNSLLNTDACNTPARAS